MDWHPWHGGPAPDTGGRKVIVRLRCSPPRSTVEFQQEPQEPAFWRRWKHQGNAGDIIEFAIV